MTKSERLSDLIRQYWALRGGLVKIEIIKTNDLHCIRSDMINGLPLHYVSKKQVARNVIQTRR